MLKSHEEVDGEKGDAHDALWQTTAARRVISPERPASGAGGRVSTSVLSPGVRVESGAEVSNSIVLNDVRIGPGAVVRNAILDKNVVVPPGAQIGVDAEADRAAGYTVEDGLTVLSKGQKVTGGDQ